jgi:hypothetical protein
MGSRRADSKSVRRQPLAALRREHDQLPSVADFVASDNAHTTLMASNFDVEIVRSVPLIHDFDDFDPPLSTIKTSGRRSAIRVRLNLNAHVLIQSRISRG